MTLKVCAEPSCPVLTKTTRCPEHTRAKDRARGTRQERGYDTEHERLRAELLPQAYGRRCIYCGERMWPHQHLDLDHTDDRKGYRGIVHADYRDCPRGGNRARRGPISPDA